MTTSNSALLIARLSGLPASTMEDFSSRLGDILNAIAKLEANLSSARNELVEQLHSAIHNAPTEKRHALLEVKRDCFNGRPLTRYRTKLVWMLIKQAAPALAEQVIELEENLAHQKQEFVKAHGDETTRQYHCVAGLIDNPMFRCGLAVASNTVASESGRLKVRAPEDYGRREKRLAATVLRYASRASLKLSPFSTFTPVGLCRVEGGSEPLRLLPGEWDQHSLVRVRRHILDRCTDALCLYEPWRRTLSVAINDSVSKLEDGRTLHRRPGQYRVDEDTKEIRYYRESLVRARLQGPLVQRLQSLLASGPLNYVELLKLIEDEMDAHSESIKEEIDSLIDLGFLYLALPWSADEGHLEKMVLQKLQLLPHDPALQNFIELLERLVLLEGNLFSANEPGQTLLRMQQTMDEMVFSATRIAQLPTNTKTASHIPGHDIYQDVWCSPKSDKGLPVVSVGRTAMEQAQRSAEPLLRYSRLFDRRLDLLFSVGSVLEKSKGKHCRLDLLSAFDAVRDLFQEYVSHESAIRSTEEQHSTWNPLGLDVLDHLLSVRTAARESLRNCWMDDAQGRTISISRFNLLLDEIPDAFKKYQGGGCLFLQPATADGSLWVLNRLKEGTGRMSSRYTPLMPAPLRHQYADGLARRAVILDNDECLQILDIHCVSGDTLNVHAPQTPKVLVLPATHMDIAPERRLSLAELFVTVGEDGWPTLQDRSGQRYLASYIGLAGSTYLPTLVKFLCAFGPTDTIPLYPERLQREVDGITVRERTRIGNVVLMRKSWSVPALDLRRILEDPGSPEAFERLHRFLRKFEIPTRLFVAEKLNSFPRGKYHKPQYLDLSSPLFISILHSIALAAEGSLVLVETLPEPEMMPRDSKGQRWAVELLVDAVALQSPVDERAMFSLDVFSSRESSRLRQRDEQAATR